MPITATKEKKNGLTKYRVRVNYTDENGDYKTVERTAYGKAEAQELERRLSADTKKPTSERMTVQALYDEYIETMRHEVRETSLGKTIQALSAEVLPDFAGKALADLNAKNLGAWKNRMAEKDLSITTKRNYFKYFRALLNFAVKRGYLASNPLNRVGNFKDPYLVEEETVLHYYTAEQFLAFSEQARQSAENKNTLQEWGYYVFFSISFYLGTRKGEANALRWSDIEGDRVHIRRSVTQKLKGEPNVFTAPKNKSSIRELTIPAPLMEILKEHRERCKLMPEFSDEWFVCGGADTLADATIEYRNAAFSSAAGLPHIRIHDFRHSHASLLCNEGINIQEIARRLGHSDVQTTWRTYAHLYPREEERAVEILNKIMPKK